MRIEQPGDTSIHRSGPGRNRTYQVPPLEDVRTGSPQPELRGAMLDHVPERVTKRSICAVLESALMKLGTESATWRDRTCSASAASTTPWASPTHRYEKMAHAAVVLLVCMRKRKEAWIILFVVQAASIAQSRIGRHR